MADFQRRQSAMVQPATQQMDISQVLQAISQQRQAEAFGLQSQEKTLQIEELKRQLDRQQRVRELVQSGASPQDITAQTGDVEAATNLLSMYGTQQDLLNKGLTAGQIRASTAQSLSAAEENRVRADLTRAQILGAQAKSLSEQTQAEKEYNQYRVNNLPRAIDNFNNRLKNIVDPYEAQKLVQTFVDQFGDVDPGIRDIFTPDGRNVPLESVQQVLQSGDVGRYIDALNERKKFIPTTANKESQQDIQKQLNTQAIQGKENLMISSKVSQDFMPIADAALEAIESIDPALLSENTGGIAKTIADLKALGGDENSKKQLEGLQKLSQALSGLTLTEAAKKALVGNLNFKEFETVEGAAAGKPTGKEATVSAIRTMASAARLNIVKENMFNKLINQGVPYAEAYNQVELQSRTPTQIQLPEKKGTVYFSDFYKLRNQEGLSDPVIVKLWQDGLNQVNKAKNLSNDTLQEFDRLNFGGGKQ